MRVVRLFLFCSILGVVLTGVVTVVSALPLRGFHRTEQTNVQGAADRAMLKNVPTAALVPTSVRARSPQSFTREESLQAYAENAEREERRKLQRMKRKSSPNHR